MTLIARIKQYFRKVGFMAPLSFDQQVWGAKSVIDLVQHGSQFLIAQGTAVQSTYTCWLGARDKLPTAIVIDSTGHATGPFPDDSRIKDCLPWTYPPKVTCAQATVIMNKSGITEAWTTCELIKTSAQPNPVYNFGFATHGPVTVDAVSGKII